MLTVHHLNDSRSQRILWLLEELQLDYDIVFYQRDADTNLAPPELEAIHPLGKSTVLTDGENTVIESGAIIDYVLRRYGAGRLLPETGTPSHEQYLQWLHYAEGSAMLPLMLRMYTSRWPDGGEALQPRINDELDRHLGFMNRAVVDQHATHRSEVANDEPAGRVLDDGMSCRHLFVVELRGALVALAERHGVGRDRKPIASP